MISFTLVSIFLITVGFIWWITNDKNGGKGKPIPGPTPIPVLGNILQMGREQHIKFAEWGEKYGDIFKVKLGSKLSYVISDPKMIKEIYSDTAFSGRQFFEGFEMYPNEPLGIVASEGELWEVHRRFLLRQLRDFGFGKSSMEQLIMDEVNETISRFTQLQKSNHSIQDVKQILLVAVVNSLFAIVASKRFKHDDPEMLEMMELGNQVGKELISRAIFLLIPWTRLFLPSIKGFEEIRDKNRQFYIDLVDEHKKTYKEENIRDFIDVYLTEMKAQKDSPDSMFYGNRAERQLHVILADLHFAGSDTTSSTLAFLVLYLSKYKHVQEKLQAEISSVTGENSRQVSVSDRPNMPYTLAVIDEVMRVSSIVPNGLQHSALIGKDYKGYYIPKDTWIFPNLYYIHHNKKIWGDPQNFRPERFLSADGLTYQKNENLLPFQIGRRQCVGETLARDTIFLFITNIFQKFTINFDPNCPEPTMKPAPGIVLAPEPFSVVVKDRSQF